MSATRGSYDVVCLSHLRWGFVYQRPQHLLSRWAREHRVFYFEEPVESAEMGLEQRQTPEGVTVVVPRLPAGLDMVDLDAIQQTLLDELFVREEIDRYLLWMYTPMAAHFAEHLKPLATIYDCMDELTGFAGAPRELAERERRLLRRADLVFTGGQSLFEAKRKLHSDVHAFPSSVDAAHFRSAREGLPEPPDLAGIPRPRLGWYGVIDERVDLRLLAELADARSEWQIVMVGPVAKIDPKQLPQRPNIHYLGMKAYDELPAYAGAWDVALMPFARNDSTRFISPTKTLEYLAAGVPVVSTPIADVVRPYGDAGLVGIAEDVSGLIDEIESALDRGFAPVAERVDELLEQTSWDHTFERMREHVANAVAGPPAPGRATVRPRTSFDYLVVGAGFAGCTIAERLASQAGKSVLVVDRRPHIGGNAYDHYDDHGLLVHRYGPHIFHTNSKDVFDYLSRFTAWRPYEHRVRASVDGRLVPMPINLDTINELYGLNLCSDELEAFFQSVAEPVGKAQTSEDVVVGRVGRELYEKFFRNYTRKQWGMDPSELDASVTARVPVRTNRDDRYFTDTYQAMPLHGYTRMFERMLDHPQIKVLLQTDYREVEGLFPYGELVYTGPIDEFFDLRFGKLPYRSLEFRFETYDTAVYQPAAVVNYPNEHAYTRATEFKYLTGQEHAKTTVVYEIPQADGDPYYPVPRPENAELYKRYKTLADATEGVHFLGRLATYKYYNMDQVTAQALSAYRRIVSGADVTAAAEVG